MAWPMPPQMHNEEGRERRCGVEIEYVGVSLRETAGIVENLWGGKAEWRHDHHATVHTEALGSFTVELDVEWMQKLSAQAKEERENAGTSPKFADTAEKMLSSVVSSIAPNEIVTPPIPFSRLCELEAMVAKLRHAGAKGTGESILYAFGVHLNPEVPSERSEILLHYLQAFLLLYEWMKDAMKIDATRMLTGFAKSFPMEYVRKIMRNDYCPDLRQFIDDYLHYNPTRNRALDMLPVFAHIDAARVAKTITDTLVKGRPTFHFRLPNCHIDREEWQLSESWQYWTEVEKLAYDKERLHAMKAAFLKHYDSPLHIFSDSWKEQTLQWLPQNR